MDIIKYAMEQLHNINVLKKTVSIVSKAISSNLRYPCRAKAFVFSPARNEINETIEGEVIGIPMGDYNAINIDNAISKITDVLQMENKNFELVVFIDEKHERFGIALVEYYDPCNW